MNVISDMSYDVGCVESLRNFILLPFLAKSTQNTTKHRDIHDVFFVTGLLWMIGLF